MNFGAATYGLGLIAGSLSILSPCVLPLVPVLVAAAVNAHRWGALALGLGLTLLRPWAPRSVWIRTHSGSPAR